MAQRYEVTADAASDLADIENYIYSYTQDWRYVDARIDELLELFNTIAERPLAYPVYQFPQGFEPTHEYRSANAYHYKVFYRVDASQGNRVLIYRVRHMVSDFTAVEFG